LRSVSGVSVDEGGPSGGINVGREVRAAGKRRIEKELLHGGEKTLKVIVERIGRGKKEQ
jgi:hypothetical protein